MGKGRYEVHCLGDFIGCQAVFAELDQLLTLSFSALLEHDYRLSELALF